MRFERAVMVALALICLCGAASAQPPGVPQPGRALTKEEEAVVAVVQKEFERVKRLPREDIAKYTMPHFPRTQSAWRAAEKSFYQSILSKGQFDILVVPFQVQDSGFARDIRSLMTAQLARAIADTGKTVADPYLVARALGDGDRRFELQEIFDLANAIGAKRIVLGYVGYALPKGKMRITLNVYDRPAHAFSEVLLPRPGNVTRVLAPHESMLGLHLEDVDFMEPTTPIDAWQALLPQSLGFLGLTPASTPLVKASRIDPLNLPRSPFQIGEGKSEPARDAYLLQLLAALTPESADRERERMIEKSMLAVLRLSPDSADYRLLRARALSGLGLRAAAIRALGTPTTAEERHFRAVLNGNLPEVRSYRAQRPAGARALLVALEENSVATAYYVRTVSESEEVVTQLKLAEPWIYFARRATTDWDWWMQDENLRLKALLDKELPVEGFTADAMRRGAVAVGDVSRMRTAGDLSVLDHLRRRTRAATPQWCCQPLEARAGQTEVLDLVEGIATDNLLRRGRYLLTLQGNADSAMSFLASIDSAYKDHPDFVELRGEAEVARAAKSDGSARDGLYAAAYRNGLAVWGWEQGQTRTAMRAFENIVTPADRREIHFQNYYTYDYPYRSFYSTWFNGMDGEAQIRNARAALENSSYDYAPVRTLDWLLRDRREEFDALLGSLSGRFSGNTYHVRFMAQASLRKGDSPAARNYYRQAIQTQPDAEALYAEFGKLLFEEGATDESSRVFMSYPGLKNPSAVNTVGLANYAYEAGSLFYWTGDFARAIPLYKVAAGLNTGSESSMASEARLALLNGDHLAAFQGTAERANRYRSGQSYRDYLGMLHAFGGAKEAWAGFVALLPTLNQPYTWDSALVGHRREGAGEAEIAAWAAKEPMRSAAGRIAYAPAHVLRAAVTDRTPSPNFAAQLAALERPVWQLQNPQRSVVRAGGEGDFHVVLGPTALADGTLIPGMFERTQKARVKSDLVYYAEAYVAIRGGKFDVARTLLEEAAALYDMRNPFLGYLLPPYAYAAARSGNTGALEKLLESFPTSHRRFDYELARATIAAVARKPEQALRSLDLALHRRAFTERRPVFTEYQYGEMCEWLFEATGDGRYRTLALEWAKQNQVLQPWMAWPFAMHARLAVDAAERGAAIAMTHYLDPRSERLSTLPKDEVANAIKTYSARNPFRRALEAAPKQPI